MDIGFIDSIMPLIPKPDTIFYVRIEHDESKKRLKKLSSENDRMEQEKADFFNGVINCYDELTVNNFNMVMLNGLSSIENIHSHDLKVLLTRREI